MICILVRDFVTTQEKRLNPALSDRPLILIEAGKYRPKVIAPDAQARQAGVKSGDWLGQARTLCSTAEFLPVEPVRYQRIFMDVTLHLLNITDRIAVEYQPTSAVWYTDDKLMLPHLLKAIEAQTGIQPQVGIARTKFPARVAAAVAHNAEVMIVPDGEEAAFLAPYPVTLLPLDKTMQRRLPLLGLDTLGQLAKLPQIAIWEQFGKHGCWLHDLANGIDIRPLTPIMPPVMLKHCHPFDEPVSDRQILHRVLERVSLALIECLQGREAHHLTLMLHLENKILLEHSRHLHEPVRDSLYLLRLLTQMLDALPVSNAIETIEVRLNDVRERIPVQLSLFDEKKPVKQLYDLLPEWASRYRSTGFYRLSLTGVAHLPERGMERHKVSAG